ncbi:MAG: excinuclease ABC subunit A [Candidatus Eisenbacteria bacterium]|nr:excinuclease ABC subunit A [Candidatus Eisenbacteria bacterium]
MIRKTAATRIQGAKTHNLQSVDCRIPLGRLTVITGVSGSGKSSLAFDTLYAEGQRRFVECLSAYARQFLERLERPEVEWVGRVEPPIALKQKTHVRNARSTVGSLTELNDDLRLLWTHAGRTICPRCDLPAVDILPETVIDHIAARPAGMTLLITAPMAAEEWTDEARRDLAAKGYVRVFRYGEIRGLEEARAGGDEEILLIVDRLRAGRLRRPRLRESIAAAWRLGQGRLDLVALSRDGVEDERRPFRQGLQCPACGDPFPRLTPAHFSSNSPLGACPACEGFGRIITIDPDKVVPDTSRSLREHAVALFATPAGASLHRALLHEARRLGIPVDTPWRRLRAADRRWVWEGNERYPGVERFVAWLERKKYKMHVRVFLARFRGYVPCRRCGGARLREEPLRVRIDGRTLADLQAMTIGRAGDFLDRLELPPGTRPKVAPVLRDLRHRLDYLNRVDLTYLTLDRAARTLSGGETQRIRLAAALGSGLTDTLYILDEPTAGLHARDAELMLRALHKLCRQGNTVVVVEHDPAIIKGADHLIVLGPAGGEQGGRKLFEGTVNRFFRRHPGFFHPQTNGSRRSADGKDRVRAASGRATSAPRKRRRAGRTITLHGVQAHNLNLRRLSIPVDAMTVVTGVSGSGKSTLVDHVLHRNDQRFRGRPVEEVGSVDRIRGLDGIAETVLISQNPLGRSTRSTPLSFVKAFPEIRRLLAETPAARRHRLRPGDFSFNTPGGRCEACSGTGVTVLEMHFLPDVEIPCDVCLGRRFQPQVLEAAWKGRSILDILQMTVNEAARFFRAQPRIAGRLAPLQTVGLGYVRLGQPTSHLSGGEAQRLRIAAYLAAGRARERSLLIFDEPTTGLHPQDVQSLIRALRELQSRGFGVLVVEHQLDLIESADWVIDLGPGAGEAGGRLVYAGQVEGLLDRGSSVTGASLARYRRERSRLHRKAARRSS